MNTTTRNSKLDYGREAMTSSATQSSPLIFESTFSPSMTKLQILTTYSFFQHDSNGVVVHRHYPLPHLRLLSIAQLCLLHDCYTLPTLLPMRRLHLTRRRSSPLHRRQCRHLFPRPLLWLWRRISWLVGICLNLQTNNRVSPAPVFPPIRSSGHCISLQEAVLTCWKTKWFLLWSRSRFHSTSSANGVLVLQLTLITTVFCYVIFRFTDMALFNWMCVTVSC